MTKTQIEKLVKKNNGNIRATARQLGMSNQKVRRVLGLLKENPCSIRQRRTLLSTTRRTVDTFADEFDPERFIPARIKKVLDEMLDDWIPENLLCRAARLAAVDIENHRNKFAVYIVPTGKIPVWAKTPKLAKQMRAMA